MKTKTKKTEDQDQLHADDSTIKSVDDLGISIDSIPQESDEIDFKDLCCSVSCHAHDDGTRFSEYLEELRMEGFDAPFEESMPSDFLVPDALTIMDARIAKIAEIKSRIGSDDEELKDDTSRVENDELEMDSSLQEYLESENDDIMTHPLYKRLCAAHISLCKLGATDAQLKEMEELSYELGSKLPDEVESSSSIPELDKFMNDYCEFLELHKKEFEKPFDEVMDFCKQVDEELADSGLNFFRNNNNPSLTNETIAKLQELPFEGEV
ncbi:hypothetical protein R1flu_014376 [Riccia fluitans]|uniref:KNOX2 domain-containing protein n=1 Tax=Riccia fluitans TaxID=41844 RepID=A0ABD1YG93_9MARC